MRCALLIEYDGSDFNGWQRQPNAPTVQQNVEEALSRVADQPIKTICAGRTDAGVHARGQVVHFDTDSLRTARSWCLGANTHLPPTVSVIWAGNVAEDFNARFSAIERSYSYTILNRSTRAGLDRQRVWTVPRPLDIQRMRTAAKIFPGEHDFSAFRAASCQANNARRNVSRLEIEAYGDKIVVQVCANAFLQNMVRIIVGVLVTVGSGDQEPHWVGELLSHGDRTQGGPTVPACGLSLAQVRYPDEYGIPVPGPTFI